MAGSSAKPRKRSRRSWKTKGSDPRFGAHNESDLSFVYLSTMFHKRRSSAQIGKVSMELRDNSRRAVSWPFRSRPQVCGSEVSGARRRSDSAPSLRNQVLSRNPGGLCRRVTTGRDKNYCTSGSQQTSLGPVQRPSPARNETVQGPEPTTVD